MAGIVGIFNFGRQLVKKENLERMADVIGYRGPDGWDYFVENNIGMGQGWFLTMGDLGRNGCRPITNENENLVIVYDGEIYNFFELRRELEKLGHRFNSNSDAEVALHSYEQWGTGCSNLFNGKWAFAIWDKKKKKLFCSRDRLGMKPYYYYCDGRIFAFASEPKSLFGLDIPREPNDALIYDFLKFSISEHKEETFFKNIKKLPAAHWLEVKESGEVIIKRYWDFEVSEKTKSSKKDNKEYIEEFRELLTDSISIRLRDGGPFGFSLSGGLDSSSMVCLAADLLKKEKISIFGEKLKTFSICFRKKHLDERRYIEEVIARTNSEKNYIFPLPEDFLEESKNALSYMGEPYFWIVIHFWKLFEAASKKVKVLLGGSGADSVLGSSGLYIAYLEYLLKDHQFRSFLYEGARFMLAGHLFKRSNLEAALLHHPEWFVKLSKVENLLSPSFLKEFQDRTYYFERTLNQSLRGGLGGWLIEFFLKMEDRISAAHFIEIRFPFFDHRIIEKLASFPLDQKIKNGSIKIILRKSMKGILPEKIIKREQRQGFILPERTWIAANLDKEIKPVIKESRFIPAYVNKNKLLSTFDNPFFNKTLWGLKMFFRFYILELWGREFFIDYKDEYSIKG